MKLITGIMIMLLGITPLAVVALQDQPDSAIPPLRIQSELEYAQMPSVELIQLMEEYIQRGEELYAMEQFKASYPYLERANTIGDLLLERARRSRDMAGLRELAEQRLREAREAIDGAEDKVK